MDLPRIDRRTQIIEETATLFSRKGFVSTSLKDVAERCNITKAALYHYFPDKDSLVRAVYVTRLTLLNKSMRQVLGNAPEDPVARIVAFLTHCASRIEANREAWIVSSQSFGSMESSRATIEAVALRDEFELMLRTEIERAVAAKTFRPVDPSLAARMLLSWVNYLPRWYRKGSGLTAEQVCNVFVDISFNGLLMPPTDDEPSVE